MFNIADVPIVLGVVGFLAALLATRIGIAIARRLAGTGAKPVAKGAGDTVKEHSLRSLEAELRVARKKAEVAEQQVQAMEDDMADLRDEVNRLESKLVKGQDQLDKAEQTLKDEIAKTVGLRHRLTDQAEETIRARVKARDIETELSIRQAGSNLDDDALEQIAAEHEELTGRLQALQAKISDNLED